MQYTTNYNLNKPQAADQFNIEHWNQNTDTIDSQMHTNEVGIATNKADISTIIANLTSNKSSDSSSTYFKLMKLIYPVGSIYWSGNSTNPASLFGGTWVQIKDRFIWAKGDSDTVNATGGAKTVTLAVANIPSHTHSFTPAGSVSAHAHGLNNHTHSFTPAGSVSVKTNPTFKGSAVNTGGMSANETHNHYVDLASSNWGGSSSDTNRLDSSQKTSISYQDKTPLKSASVAHTHSVTAAGTISGGAYTFTGSAGTTGGNTGNTANATPTFTGTAGTTGGSSANTANATPTFTGTAGTTGSTGSGTAINNMPPYIIKYCWERTA